MAYVLSILVLISALFVPSADAKKVKKNGKKNVQKHNVKKTEAVSETAIKSASFSDGAEKNDDEIPAHVVSNIYIKVLLHEQSSITPDGFFIESSDGFILENPLDKEKKGVWKATRINLIVKNDVLYVQCKDGNYRRVKHNNLIVSPCKDSIKLNKKSYHGKLNIRIDKSQQKLLVINRLNLDDYIYSVLRNEMLSYWPLEIQKVQAIASRTYALHHMRHVRSRNPNNLYDIKNTNCHQVYGGTHDSKHLRRAVNETHNLILTYNNNIALTMFDICCGGVVPAKMAIKDAEKPYLFRENRCTYCKESSSYEWKSSYDFADLDQAIKLYSCKPKECAKLGKLIDIGIAEKDKAGVVKKIRFVGSKNKVTLTIQDVKRCLSCASLPVPKSYCFDAKSEKKRMKIVGRGYGHNLGLCQVGARELIRQGWNYREILAFYYPETTLARLAGE